MFRLQNIINMDQKEEFKHEGRAEPKGREDGAAYIARGTWPLGA